MTCPKMSVILETGKKTLVMRLAWKVLVGLKKKKTNAVHLTEATLRLRTGLTQFVSINL